jgi:hypothetical protein
LKEIKSYILSLVTAQKLKKKIKEREINILEQEETHENGKNEEKTEINIKKTKKKKKNGDDRDSTEYEEELNDEEHEDDDEYKEIPKKKKIVEIKKKHKNKKKKKHEEIVEKNDEDGDDDNEAVSCLDTLRVDLRQLAYLLCIAAASSVGSENERLCVYVIFWSIYFYVLFSLVLLILVHHLRFCSYMRLLLNVLLIHCHLFKLRLIFLYWGKSILFYFIYNFFKM